MRALRPVAFDHDDCDDYGAWDDTAVADGCAIAWEVFEFRAVRDLVMEQEREAAA